MGEGGSLARSFNINGGARRKGVILLRFQTIETGIINLQATRLSSTQTRLMERAWPSPGGRSQHAGLRPGQSCLHQGVRRPGAGTQFPLMRLSVEWGGVS